MPFCDIFPLAGYIFLFNWLITNFTICLTIVTNRHTILPVSFACTKLPLNFGAMHQITKSVSYLGLLMVMYPRWRHQMETFSTLLALCAGNSPVSGEFPSQRPVTRSFDAFFLLCLNKRLSKQSWGWWSETPSCSLWRHCNVFFCCNTGEPLSSKIIYFAYSQNCERRI